MRIVFFYTTTTGFFLRPAPRDGSPPPPSTPSYRTRTSRRLRRPFPPRGRARRCTRRRRDSRSLHRNRCSLLGCRCQSRTSAAALASALAAASASAAACTLARAASAIAHRPSAVGLGLGRGSSGCLLGSRLRRRLLLLGSLGISSLTRLASAPPFFNHRSSTSPAARHVFARAHEHALALATCSQPFAAAAGC